MSLINDALKQAGKAQKENPPPPSPLQFRAAEPLPRRSYSPPAILFAVLLVVLVLGGLLVVFALQKSSPLPQAIKAAQPDTTAADAQPPVAAAPPAPAAPPQPSANPSTALAPTATVPLETPPGSADAPAVSTTTPNPTSDTQATVAPTNVPDAIAPVEPPKPVMPKLQGIFYNPARPSAVVSGKTVYIGNSVVGGFRVIAITAETVTVASATQTNVLSLSE